MIKRFYAGLFILLIAAVCTGCGRSSIIRDDVVYADVGYANLSVGEEYVIRGWVEEYAQESSEVDNRHPLTQDVTACPSEEDGEVQFQFDISSLLDGVYITKYGIYKDGKLLIIGGPGLFREQVFEVVDGTAHSTNEFAQDYKRENRS